MNNKESNRYLYPFKAVLAGMLASQFIGFIHVYLSNKALYSSMYLVHQAGYLAVPNEQIWASLQNLGPAFWGGLFFTLSVGTGLSVIGLLGAWSWDRLFNRRRPFLAIYIITWLACVVAANLNGFSAVAAAYPLFIPPVVFVAVLHWLPSRQDRVDRLHRLLFWAVPVLLFFVWLPIAKGQVFLDIRDNVLLTNALGRQINNFYYEHTLYAAQAFKSLEHKTIKTSSLQLQTNESHRSVIKEIFLSHDYLVVEGDGPVDLAVKEQGAELVFYHRDKQVIITTIRNFSADPAAVLSDFSSRTDRFKPLKLIAFGSMVAGSPFCLYIILHGLFFIILNLFLKPRKAGVTAVIFCFVLGSIWALPMYMDKNQNVELGNLNQALESTLWQQRVAALRYMSTKGLSNDQVAEKYQDWLKSPYIAERYWYVRSLGASQTPAAGKALLTALDDPSTNVVCMAYYSLGRRGDKSAVDEIKSRMQTTGKWYEQYYAYRALRALSWKQAGP